jgi:hypothetical protein
MLMIMIEISSFLTILNLREFGSAEREFSVQDQSAPPRFRKQLEFVQKGYAAGDLVKAKLDVSNSEGQIPVDAKVEIQVQIDGNQIHSQPLSLDPTNSTFLEFTLPDELPDNPNGNLNISIDDGINSNSKIIFVSKYHA